jgi:hypothetical protein
MYMLNNAYIATNNVAIILINILIIITIILRGRVSITEYNSDRDSYYNNSHSKYKSI